MSESGSEQIPEKLEDQTAEVKETASAAADQAGRAAEAAWHEAKKQISDLQLLEEFIREKPTRALLVIFGIGFVMGLVWRK